MPLTINSNIGASIGNRAVTETNRALERSLAKLSSGQRVESARDDGASMAIGSRLRSQVASLRIYQQNAAQGIAKLQIAEGAYQRADDMLNRMRSLSAQAQSSNLSQTERGMLDTEFQQIKAEITRLGQSTTFNGGRIFQTGAISFNTSAVSATAGASYIGQVYSADFNNDGFMDLLTGNADFAYVSLSNGGTSLGTPTAVSSTNSSRMAIGDFNGDGNMDFVRASNAAGTWEVMAGNGQGGFSVYASGSIGAGNVNGLAAGDINGDGITDFVATSSTSATVSTYLSTRGSSNFTLTTSTANGAGSYAYVNDLNNDGLADVTLINNTWAQNLLSNGSGVSAQAVFDGFASVPNVIHMFDMRFADMNNDGLVDMVVGGGINGEISVVRNNGNGTWGSVLMQLSSAQTAAMGIAAGGVGPVNVADLNGDGINDLIVQHNNGTSYVLTGGANYSYTLTQSITGGSVDTSRLVDFNNDGRMDLVTAGLGTRRVFLNQSQAGEEGSFRVSEASGNTDNVGYRAGAITLNSLADQLAFARISTRQGAQRAEDLIRLATVNLGRFRAGIGAAINRLESTNTNIANQLENMENARSAYLDLDIASEMAQFLSLQIRVQAGINMLSQANSSRQLLLRLIQS